MVPRASVVLLDLLWVTVFALGMLVWMGVL